MTPVELFFLHRHVMSFILCTAFTPLAPYDSLFFTFFFFCGFPTKIQWLSQVLKIMRDRVDVALTTCQYV